MPANWLPVPHRKQTDGAADCLAACAAMVLDFLGVSVPYKQLVSVLNIQEFGAPASNLRNLTTLGLRVSYGPTSLGELARHIAGGQPCIVPVFTGELSYWTQATDHAVVVVGLDEQTVYVNDPYFDQAPQPVPREEFILAWLEKDYRCAIISQTAPQ